MRFRVLPYKTGSKSAKTLARELDGLRLKFNGAPFRAREGDMLINWGSSERPYRLDGLPMLNAPELVPNVSDKRSFFRRLKYTDPDIIPNFWEDPISIPDEAFPIFCRTVLNGHSGRGIVVANDRDELVSAPLYVQYVNKKQEYRVHVGRRSLGKNPERIIAVQRKARSKSVPDSQVNWQIRNHANGFVFARQDVKPPVRVLDVARRAFAASGLDFGAVDVVDNEHQKRAYVLEINSAPGLEGSTVHDYARHFKEYA